MLYYRERERGEREGERDRETETETETESQTDRQTETDFFSLSWSLNYLVLLLSFQGSRVHLRDTLPRQPKSGAARRRVARADVSTSVSERPLISGTS